LLVVDALEETGRRLSEGKPQSVDEVREGPGKIVELAPAGRERLTELEDFLMENVYQHEQVAAAQQRAGAELRYLFAAYLKDSSLLPGQYQQRIDELGRHRVVCDYLAGMTDRYCRRQYEELH
ncbi:deoxyguanosinetriphosphate triphosphohydrolase, partial [Planctomycetota bacterium]